MIRNKFQLVIENSYVKKVLTTLYMPVMCNTVPTNEQIKAIDVLINVFNAFEYFKQNKQQLLIVKKMWEEAAMKNSVDKSAFKLSVALNTIINSYEKMDEHFNEFQKYLPLIIKLLETRKNQRIENSDANISSNKFQSDFFAEPKSNQDNKSSSHEHTDAAMLSQ